MILEVHERLQLLQLIPKEGKYEALRTWRQQREMLSFTPEEVETLQFKNIELPGGNVRTEWDQSQVGNVVKDIPIPEFCMSYYRKSLADLDEKGKLNEQMMSLFEKFVVLGFR